MPDTPLGASFVPLYSNETLQSDFLFGHLKSMFGKLGTPPNPAIVKFKNSEICVDPFVLSCRSQYFETFFEHAREFNQEFMLNVDETIFVQKGILISYDDIMCVLEFAFGNFDQSINENNAVAVCILSNMWLITDFKKCETEICRAMDENSMIFCAELGYMTKSKQILKKCAELMSEFADKIPSIQSSPCQVTIASAPESAPIENQSQIPEIGQTSPANSNLRIGFGFGSSAHAIPNQFENESTSTCNTQSSVIRGRFD